MQSGLILSEQEYAKRKVALIVCFQCKHGKLLSSNRRREEIEMAGILVAGRVDEAIKAKADTVLARAGITASEAIRIVWANMATTGTAPKAVDKTKEGADLTSRLAKLRAETPRSAFLESLTPDGLKKELEKRG